MPSDLTELHNRYYFQFKGTDLVLTNIISISKDHVPVQCDNVICEVGSLYHPNGRYVLSLHKDERLLTHNNKLEVFGKNEYAIIGGKRHAPTAKSVESLYRCWVFNNEFNNYINNLFKKYFEVVSTTVYESEVSSVSLNQSNNIKLWINTTILYSRKFNINNLPPKIDFTKYPYILALAPNETGLHWTLKTKLSTTTRILRNQIKGILKNTDYRSSTGLFFFKREEDITMAKMLLSDDVHSETFDLIKLKLIDPS